MEIQFHNVKVKSSKDGFIPQELIKIKPPAAAILFANLTALIDEKGSCYDRDYYLAWLSGENRTRTSVKSLLRRLQEERFIKITEVSQNEIVAILKAKNLHGQGFGDEICSWCGVKTTDLHRHHFPISRRQGGKETVDICSNCHTEFHSGIRKIEIIDKKLVRHIKEHNQESAKLEGIRND